MKGKIVHVKHRGIRLRTVSQRNRLIKLWSFSGALRVGYKSYKTTWKFWCSSITHSSPRQGLKKGLNKTDCASEAILKLTIQWNELNAQAFLHFLNKCHLIEINLLDKWHYAIIDFGMPVWSLRAKEDEEQSQLMFLHRALQVQITTYILSQSCFHT